MSITPNMNLDLPVPTVTLGPTYASQNNAAFNLLDSHDHSSGKGVPVPTSGLNINANLNFNGFKPTNLLALQLTSQASPLSGASNANSVHVSGNNLYFTNGSGTAVQITNGGSVVSVPAAVDSFETVAVSSSPTISPSDTYVYLIVDTTASRTITLPLAVGVSNGRFFAIKDASGLSNTNPITIAVQGSDLIDGAASYTVNSNFECVWVTGDGVSNWYIS